MGTAEEEGETVKKETEIKLEDAKEYCDRYDKSTPFMIQYMQDMAGVTHECVINYLMKCAKKKNEND